MVRYTLKIMSVSVSCGWTDLLEMDLKVSSLKREDAFMGLP